MSTQNYSNFDNATELPPWVTLATDLRVWITIMIITSTVGALCCIPIICAVFSKSQFRRSASNVLIVNQVFGILISCAVFMPIMTYSYNTKGQNTTEFCSWAFYLYLLFSFHLGWADLMIVWNRFIAICFPMSYAYWSRKRVVSAMVSISWVVSIIAPRISLWFHFTITLTPPWGSCFPVKGDWDVDGVAYQDVISTYIPTSLTAILFVTTSGKIFWDWRKHSALTHAINESGRAQKWSSPGQHRRYRIFWMLFVAFAVYTLLILPVRSVTGPILVTNKMLTLYFRFMNLLAHVMIPVSVLRVWVVVRQ